MQRRLRVPWRLALAPLFSAVVARGLPCQTQYHNLDSGRPGRVEDAEPASLYSLDVDFAAYQFEHLTGGTNRYRAEPKIGYGILPFTEVEVRAPLILVEPPRFLVGQLPGVLRVKPVTLHAGYVGARAADRTGLATIGG